MKTDEVIRKFLIEQKISFHEIHDSFSLPDLKISIFCEKVLTLNKHDFTILAMEIGLKTIGVLAEDLKKCEGAEIYDFGKKGIVPVPAKS
jgi:hypothetical protein